MKLDCKYITSQVFERTQERLKSVYRKTEPPTVALFYVGDDPHIERFIRLKRDAAQQLGIVFDVIRFHKAPLFQTFASKLRAVAQSRNVHAVIIQRPLPPELSSASLENFIPSVKEVEGQKYKSPYLPPIGKATLSLLKYTFTHDWHVKNSDSDFFKKTFKKQFIVIAGRGPTSGRPIASTLVRYKIPTVITHSQTPYPELFYKQADVLITTTGRPIVHEGCIKQGALLMNFGYRFEEGKTYGDYHEAEIENKAGYYTAVSGGTGPLHIAFLMENIVSAYIAQIKKRTRED